MTSDANLWRPSHSAPVRSAPRTAGRRAAAAVMAAAPAAGRAPSRNRIAQRKRRINGLALVVRPDLRWYQRLLRNHYFWAVLVVTISYCLLVGFSLYNVGQGLITEINKVTADSGVPVNLGWAQVLEAYRLTAKMALPTLAAYVGVFWLIDRIWPTSLAMKWVCLGWGGAVAIFLSLHINTWASRLMQMVGPVDPSTGARAAIYSAPFVEEATKATVLFVLAVLLRRRMVNVHQVVALAGLSGVGFAFVENIVYYIRQYLYAANFSGDDPQASLEQLARLRGLMTSFGHPTFTSMTALGLVVGLTNRSKLVRILAPVAGYLAAALGHMAFNGFASISSNTTVLVIVGWAVVAALVVYLVFRHIHQTRQLRARLAEFVTMGWLEPDDPRVYSSWLGRSKMEIVAFLHGPRTYAATRRMRLGMLELAYLRDGEGRGIIDATSIQRQRDVILAIDRDRIWAITEYKGLKWIPQTWKLWWRDTRQRLLRRGRVVADDDVASLPAPVGVPASPDR